MSLSTNPGRALFPIMAAVMGACGGSSLDGKLETAHVAEVGTYDGDGPLVPIMSGNTAPSGVVTRSGVYSSSYEAWQAFDVTTGTLWLSNMNASSVWIGYEWGGGVSKTVSSYEIKYNNGSCCEQRGPKNWTLQGWNGSTWVTVDTVTNQTGWYSNPVRSYTVDSPGAFVKYRLNVTADNYNGSSPITLVSIASFQLYGTSGLCGDTYRPYHLSLMAIESDVLWFSPQPNLDVVLHPHAVKSEVFYRRFKTIPWIKKEWPPLYAGECEYPFYGDWGLNCASNSTTPVEPGYCYQVQLVVTCSDGSQQKGPRYCNGVTSPGSFCTVCPEM